MLATLPAQLTPPALSSAKSPGEENPVNASSSDQATATPTDPRADILSYLKKSGQRLDTEIAKEMNLPLATVREQVLELGEAREIMLCWLTRFSGGKPVEGWLCRVSGYSPSGRPRAQGQGAGARLTFSHASTRHPPTLFASIRSCPLPTPPPYLPPAPRCHATS